MSFTIICLYWFRNQTWSILAEKFFEVAKKVQNFKPRQNEQGKTMKKNIIAIEYFQILIFQKNFWNDVIFSIYLFNLHKLMHQSGVMCCVLYSSVDISKENSRSDDVSSKQPR